VNRELATKVADSVLYEGYMLYPYRPSAVKNRQRWTFGILYPPSYDEVRAGTERSLMHSECLLTTGGIAVLHLQLRFLHLRARQVLAAGEAGLAPVPSLMVNGQRVETWDEGSARTVELDTPVPCSVPVPASFQFRANLESEPLRDGAGLHIGNLERTEHEISGTVTVSSQSLPDGATKLVIEVLNESPFPGGLARNDALLRSLLSAHLILTLEGGEFVSLLDPPEALRDAVAACRNVGNFPVLVGDEGERDMLLCSPIVLYDHPQIAPESAGDFFDATEMDEMLTLRVLTLSDDEKSEMRLADEHVRSLLQRTEETARRQLERTHGAIRSMRPVSESHE
jgi:hydrogenase maturation protease